MKNVRLLFLISFVLYFVGNLLWTINIIYYHQLFEEWIINIPFSIFSVIILCACLSWYKQK